MEAMDICLATTKEISYLIMNHPIYSAIGGFICFMCLLKFYCRLTLGVYDSDQDLTGKTVLITGASAGRKRKLTEDGCEMTMQSNHFGHFLLTLSLLDLLKKSAPSRIINVSSEAYQMANLDLADLTNDRNAGGLKVYGNSKLCNILFTKELAHRLSGTGVTVNALHPGCVKTDIMNESKGLFTLMTRFIFATLGKTIEEGAQTTIYLAADPHLEKTTGKYFMDCREKAVKGKANDMKLAKSLFESSEKIVGQSFLQT